MQLPHPYQGHTFQNVLLLLLWEVEILPHMNSHINLMIKFGSLVNLLLLI